MGWRVIRVGGLGQSTIVRRHPRHHAATSPCVVPKEGGSVGAWWWRAVATHAALADDEVLPPNPRWNCATRRARPIET